MRRTALKGRPSIVVVVLLAQLALFELGFAWADDKDSGLAIDREEHQPGVSGARCWYGRGVIRHPADQAGALLEFDSQIMARLSFNESCPQGVSDASSSPYSRPVDYLWANAQFWKIDGFYETVMFCAETGWHSNNFATHSLTVRKIQTSACGSDYYATRGLNWSNWNDLGEYGFKWSPWHFFN